MEWAVSFSFRLSVCPMFSCDALPTALGVFVSGASQRLGSRISKFFRQNTTPERAWRFFDKKFEFLIPSLPLPQATKMTPDAVLDGGMETEAYA